MWSTSPLPCLTASHRGRNEGHASRQEGQIRRTQSTERVSGPTDRRKLSRKLTKAHSGSTALRITEDELVGVCYLPRAFEGLPELEEDA